MEEKEINQESSIIELNDTKPENQEEVVIEQPNGTTSNQQTVYVDVDPSMADKKSVKPVVIKTGNQFLKNKNWYQIATFAASIAVLALFVVWFILSNILLKNGTIMNLSEEAENETWYVYGKGGDIGLKILAAFIALGAIFLTVLLVFHLVKLFKNKATLKQTAPWSISMLVVAVTFVVPTTLLLINMFGTEMYGQLEESYKIGKWLINSNKVFAEISIIAAMALIVLIGWLVGNKSKNYDKLVPMVIVLFAGIGLVFYAIATGLAATGALNDWDKFITQDRWNYVISAIFSYYTFAVFAGVTGMLACLQLVLFILGNFRSIKKNKLNTSKLIIFIVAFVVTLVFFAVFASKLSGKFVGSGDINQYVLNRWLPTTDGEDVVYQWRPYSVYGSIAVAGMLLTGISNPIFEFKK